MNSVTKGWLEKNVSAALPYNHMLTVVETSFFHPKNVGFFNSKLGQVAGANQIIN